MNAKAAVVAVAHGRVPPHSLDAERSLLGGVLLDSQAFAGVLGIVKAEDFYREGHRKVFEAMGLLFKRGEPIDRVTVKSELTAMGSLEDVGGEAFVDQLDAITPIAANLAYYAKEIRDTSKARQVIETAAGIARLGYEQHGTAGEYCAEAQRRLGAVTAGVQNGMSAAVDGAWRDFTADQLRSDPPPPRYVWEPRIPAERVILLSATGGSYKTTLLTYLSACRATGKKFLDGTQPTIGETVIFTLEDGAEDYWRKMAAIRIEWGEEFDAELIAQRVHIIDAVGLLNMKMVAGEFGQYAVTELPDRLAEVIKSRAPATDLIIIETTSRVGAGENNDALAALICAAERLARLTHAAIVLVTHVSQAAARAGGRDQHASRGGTAQSDNARGTLNISRLTAEDAKKLLPRANLSDHELERLLVFDHSKGWTSGPRAQPVILERHYNEHGPVLRLANLQAQRGESEADRIEKLRTLVERLTFQGVCVTERKLRDYTAELHTGKGQIGRLVTEACAAKAIRLEPRKGRGGGDQLFANPKAEPQPDWRAEA